MKLDKIKFASLIVFLCDIGAKFAPGEVEHLDEIVTFDVPQVNVVAPTASDISELMRVMVAGTNKIDAIKLHRKLTGWGLKESKEEVEKYWKAAPAANYTLGDMLKAAEVANYYLEDIIRGAK